jgi:hypothetical protein
MIASQGMHFKLTAQHLSLPQNEAGYEIIIVVPYELVSFMQLWFNSAFISLLYF